MKKIIIIACVLMLVGAGCAKAPKQINSVTGDKNENQPQSTVEKLKGLVGSAKMTDEIYIELMTEIARDTFKNPGRSQEETLVEIGKITKKIQDKYGISDIESNTYTQALREDKVRSAALQEKLAPIILELMKSGK